MAKFEIREVFRIASRKQVVLGGRVVEGTIAPGSKVLFELAAKLYCSAQIVAVEYLDRVSVGDTLVCLVLAEQDDEEAMLYSDLCPPGTIVVVDKKAPIAAA